MYVLTRKTRLAVVAFLATLGLASPIHAAGTSFPTTCTPDADKAFNEGLSLLHNMMYIQAEAVFNRAAQADPACAMAQWGIAMSNFHPLWPGAPSKEETARGTAAAKELSSMEAGSAIENAFAAAAVAFYAPILEGYRERIKAWADAQVAVSNAHPENTDAAAFAALARLATAPRGPEKIEVHVLVGDALDALHQKNPDHPGVIHYAIHAYDNPQLKDRGLPYAEIYDKTAPDAPHALHMPAHIFTRTGDWDKSIDLNRRSAEAARAQSSDVIQTHYVHAIDYMVYGHLQKDEHAEAARLVDEMLAIENHQVSFGGAYALAAAPVRLTLEKSDWAAAATARLDLHPAIPWGKFPQAVAMRWFAKGVGAARNGNVADARSAVAELSVLKAAMEEGGQGYWAKLTEGQILSIAAWIELAQGNEDLALAQQNLAADLEDAIGKSPVTPGHVLPARELLGDMLTELGRQDEAEEAYRATLRLSPNRARSLAALD